MLYDYIVTNYQKDEPIFLAELPGKSRESVRQEMKIHTKEVSTKQRKVEVDRRQKYHQIPVQ